ncbi:hypothetical protein [Micromonospora mirobrigensis]|uniref:Uncharacterized protein n=1 Tax=Micromonospora mirobrigensis TaxID=262898 RepID=A0A1C4V637_9ACTN|nr:hypothetical protein [Micromonospora mirobrigensis]SCE79165.1 hypothetical protein GA0070564_101968 [Micromonospora mirobrigensis]
MLPVAIARPHWPATLRSLRSLTRLAIAALVLAAGLGGPFGAGMPETRTASPSLWATAVAHPSPDAGATLPVASTSAAARSAPATTVDPSGSDRHAPLAAVQPAPPVVASVDRSADARAPHPSPVVAPSTEPGRDSVGRRGPPPR